MDISSAETVLTGLVAAITALGLVKLAPAATAVAYKWVKGAIFG